MSASIAIVGSGPSGCFLAQALLKSAPDLTVDLIDRLPVPYGLVRYGVAPDHQGTKSVIRQFERLFERQGAGFVGNLAIGEDLSLEDLQGAYDIVVLAAGLSGDRQLGIPGEQLTGVYSAGRFTRALYEHPDAESLPELGRRVVLMGNGNVAIDLLRLLSKSPAELAGSDLGELPSRWLAEQQIESIDIVGRSTAEQAKFDPVMVRELSKLSEVSIEVIDAGSSDDPEGSKRIAALESIDGHGNGKRRITFRFGLTPVGLQGADGQLSEVQFQTGSGEEVVLPCDSFLTAIGFRDEGSLPRDRLIENALNIDAGHLADGLYATGWFRRGPQGTIPDNRADAKALASTIIEDLADRASAPAKPGRSALPPLPDLVDYSGWKRIDAVETDDLPADRVRKKIATRVEMLACAHQTKETQS